MKIQLLPSTIEDGRASVRQHLSCLVVDDKVAIDAGSLAQSATDLQRSNLRDIVLTHSHLDHIAGLPLFIDDLFATTRRPIVVHAIKEVIDVLERDVFNWSVYPRFSELSNESGKVLEYRPFEVGDEFMVEHLEFRAIRVNHKVPAVGFVLSDGSKTVAMTGDTAELDGFWNVVNGVGGIDALIVECAFPNRLEELSVISHHLTPARLALELEKFRHECPIFVMSIKPAYYDEVSRELAELGIERLEIFDGGRSIEL